MQDKTHTHTHRHTHTHTHFVHKKFILIWSITTNIVLNDGTFKYSKK